MIQNQIVWISVPDFEFSNIVIVISYLSNDINQDGIWDVLDIILLINHILGENFLYESQLENADVNADGLINILDIIYINNIIIG